MANGAPTNERKPFDNKASRRQYFDAVQNGAYDAPWLPKLRSDPARPAFFSVPYVRARTLDEWRADEGVGRREARLREVWKRLPRKVSASDATERARKQEADRHGVDSLNRERAVQLKHAYDQELLSRVTNGNSSPTDDGASIEWEDFLRYANEKEIELWHIFHNELDLDGNGHLDASELRIALAKAGITLDPNTIIDFMEFLTPGPHSHALSFPEFRDFLLLMPRKACTNEIFRYYEIRKYMGDDGRGAARVNMEGAWLLAQLVRARFGRPNVLCRRRQPQR